MPPSAISLAASWARRCRRSRVRVSACWRARCISFPRSCDAPTVPHAPETSTWSGAAVHSPRRKRRLPRHSHVDPARSAGAASAATGHSKEPRGAVAAEAAPTGSTEGRRSEDVERFLGRHVVELELVRRLHALEVLDLDVLDDAAAGGG